MIAADASVFIEAPAAGCVQSFSIEDSDGNELSEQYQIDATTGQLSFTNEPGSFVDESIVIVVTTSGGIETIIQKLPEIAIKSQCGPESTIITPPDIGESAQPAN